MEGDCLFMWDLGLVWDGRRAIEIINEFIDSLLDLSVNLKSVVVIGSRARGSWRRSSDIDLVMVFDDSDGLDKIIMAEHIGLIDPKPYTVEEAFRAIENADTTMIEAFEYGVIVYDDGFWCRLRSRYEELLKGRVEIEYDENGNILRISLIG